MIILVFILTMAENYVNINNKESILRITFTQCLIFTKFNTGSPKLFKKKQKTTMLLTNVDINISVLFI